MTTRFDLEQAIMECWNVTTDIRRVSEYLLDAPLEIGRQDKIANMLTGMSDLYEVKFNNCFRLFEKHLAELRDEKLARESQQLPVQPVKPNPPARRHIKEHSKPKK